MDKVPGMHNPERKLELLSEKDPAEIADEDITPELIEYETTLWEKARMDPSNVSHDLFRLDVQINSAIRCMLEDLGLNEERFETIYRRTMYEKLRFIRNQIQGELIKQQILQGVSMKMPKDILGDNGGISN